MTVYCYDTEFLEDGSTINLISIGIVCEDGREYYAINSDMDEKRIKNDDWLCKNVIKHLPLTGKCEKSEQRTWLWSLNTRDARVKPKWVIANEVREFLLTGDAPELWAYYGAYDHVALAQLWGKMIHLPKGLPMWTHDLMQLVEPIDQTSPGKPLADCVEREQADEHDALADARWNMRLLKTARAVLA